MSKSIRLVLMALALTFLVAGCGQEMDLAQPSDVKTEFAPVGNFLSKSAVATDISASTIVSATLHLYADEFSHDTVEVHRVTAPWDETTLTWNNFGNAYGEDVYGTLATDVAGWVSSDVTALVQLWLDDPAADYGLLLDEASGTWPRFRFLSRDAAENHPYIEVTFATSAGNQTVVMADIADTYVWEYDPDAGHGTSDYLYSFTVYGTRTLHKQSLLKFDTSVVPQLGALGDRVWLDANEDGLQNDGEFGIPDVTVNLFDCDGNFQASAETDADGFYLFDGLTAGDYQLEFVAPDGYEISPLNVGTDINVDSDVNPATGLTACVTLLEGATDLSVDAGLFLPTVEDCGPCDGKVSQLTLRYDGDEAKFVKIFDSKRRRGGRLMFKGTVNPGDVITINGTRNRGSMHSQISLWSHGRRIDKLHTSCSEPIGPGMTFGDFMIIEGYSRNGGLLCPVDVPDPGDEWCELGKPIGLTLRYTGEDCSATSHSQDEREVMCDGDPEFSQTVRIVVTDRANPNDCRAKVFFNGDVELNDTFEMLASNACVRKLSPKTYVFVYDLEGNLLQRVKFHTSCSQPLYQDDQFGSVRLVDFMPFN